MAALPPPARDGCPTAVAAENWSARKRAQDFQRKLAGEALELLERVLGADVANGPGRRAHDDGVRRRALLRVADPVEEESTRDAGRGHEDVVARDQVVGGEHTLGIEAGLDKRTPLLVVAWPEAPLDGAAEALDRRCRDHALRRAADPHQHVDDAAAAAAGGDGRGNVAVPD